MSLYHASTHASTHLPLPASQIPASAGEKTFAPPLTSLSAQIFPVLDRVEAKTIFNHPSDFSLSQPPSIIPKKK